MIYGRMYHVCHVLCLSVTSLFFFLFSVLLAYFASLYSGDCVVLFAVFGYLSFCVMLFFCCSAIFFCLGFMIFLFVLSFCVFAFFVVIVHELSFDAVVSCVVGSVFACCLLSVLFACFASVETCTVCFFGCFICPF